MEAGMFGMKRAALRKEIQAESVLSGAEFTPDIFHLEQFKSQLLFVHDDMAQLQPNHDLIKEGSLSGFYPFNYGYTTKSYSFLKKNLGLKSFPIALDIPIDVANQLPTYMSEEYRIRGELYAIRPLQFLKLDTHRQNGVQFIRRRVNINIGYKKLYHHSITDSKGVYHSEYNLGKEQMLTVQAWMYVGREEYWRDQL
jgi:hypothetical protein